MPKPESRIPDNHVLPDARLDKALAEISALLALRK